MKYDAVIFDMDGLMLDTERLAMEVWKTVGARHGYEIADELCVAMVGRSARDSEQILVDALGDSFPLEAISRAWAAHYDELIDKGRLATKAGLVELLETLRAASVPTGVATTTERARALRKLGAAGLLPFFDAVTTGDDVFRPKPAPDIFVLAAQRLDTPPQRCLVLEDSDAGVAAATAAGCTVIMVPDIRPPSDESRALAHRVVRSLHDVRAYLFGT